MLPKILSGLTMNFMLYEKDYGLAIARLSCQPSNGSCEVIALNSNKRLSQDLLKDKGAFSPCSYLFPHILWAKCVVYSNCDVLLVCAHTKDHGENTVFNAEIKCQKGMKVRLKSN